MSILDTLNFKLKKEIEYIKANYPEFPLDIFDSKFLNTFKDETIRRKIYESYQFYSNSDIVKYQQNLMNLVKTNYALALYCINNDILLESNSMEVINLFGKEIIDYNLDDYTIKEICKCKDKLIEYKKTYTIEQFSKIIKNPNLFCQILALSVVEFLNKEFVFYYPNEVKYIEKADDNLKKALVSIANFNNYEDYSKLKESAIFLNKYPEAIKMWEYYGYDNQIIEDIKLFDSEGFRNNYAHLYAGFILSEDKKSDFAIKYIDYQLSNSNNLNDIKTLLFYKYWGTASLTALEQFKLLLSNAELLDDNLKSNMNFLNNISNSSSLEEVQTILNNYNVSLNGKQIQKKLSDIHLYEKIYDKILYNPKNDKSSIEYIDYEGQKIQYIKSDEIEFNMLVHRIAAGRLKDSENGEKYTVELLNNPASFIDPDIKGASRLSTSLLFESHFETFRSGVDKIHKDVILGFHNIKDDTISSISKRDGMTSMEGNGKDLQRSARLQNDLMLPHQLKDNAYFSKLYNEICISRSVNGTKKAPSYVLILKNFDSNSSTLNESAKKYAAYYNIPIVELDGNKIFANAYQKLNEKLKEFKINNTINSKDFMEVLKCLRAISYTNKKNVVSFKDVVNSLTNQTQTPEQLEQSIKLLEYALKVDEIQNDIEFQNKLTMLKEQQFNLASQNSETMEMSTNTISKGFANILLVVFVIIFICIIISIVTLTK